MTIRWQALILIFFILASFWLAKIDFASKESGPVPAVAINQSATNQPKFGSNLSYQNASLIKVPFSEKNNPERRWEVLDPQINSAAILVESLDDNYPFFYQQTYRSWPMASLTKLMTAVIVLEKIGDNKKISISAKAVATEGLSGDLQEGEIYSAQDLLKVMLLTSSNDAAVAFAEHYGEQAFFEAMNEKARELKMTQTRIEDASGLSEGNLSTAGDIAKLIRYIVANHPDILNWTRMASFLVQPVNDVNVNTIRNINPLVEEAGFLGGKTGTSVKAGQNLAVVYSFNDKQIIAVILGSRDRYAELANLLGWLGKAYNWK